MKIDITKIPSYWLTCEKTKDRWPRVEGLLAALNIPAKKVNGRLSDPYTLAVAESHLQVLKENLDNPVLILEDDIMINGDVDISEFEIPDDVDAVYLGTSLYGINFGQTRFGGVVAKDEGEWLRTFNQLSMHAIVYLSREYKEHVIGLLENFKGIGGVDDDLARSMADWKVFAAKKSWFYQADMHSEQATKTPITPIF